MKNKKMCDCGFTQSSPNPHEHSLPDKPQHTPTPWNIDCVDEHNYIGGANGRFVANLVGSPDEEDKANAAFIVKAVNAYEKDQQIKKELLETLIRAETWILINETNETLPNNETYWQVKAAIEKASLI